MFFIFHRNLIIFLCLNIIFGYSVAELIKVDANNVIIGSNVNYCINQINNTTRPTTSEDVANAVLDIVDLSAVLKGIRLPLIATPEGTSWLNLPRNTERVPESLGEHLLRGHGPSGGISQSHIITDSIFSGATNTLNGINMPAFNNTMQDELAIDPTLPLTNGGLYGWNGNAAPLDTKATQRNIDSVNVPVQNTVIDILNASDSYTVEFQVVPCRGMRKFIIDLTQNNLVNTCRRPILYNDNQNVVTPPPPAEAWLKKKQYGTETRTFSCKRAQCLVINLPNRDGTQLSALLPIIANKQPLIPIMPTEFIDQVPALDQSEGDGDTREKQQIPMTIYYTDHI